MIITISQPLNISLNIYYSINDPKKYIEIILKNHALTKSFKKSVIHINKFELYNS